MIIQKQNEIIFALLYANHFSNISIDDNYTIEYIINEYNADANLIQTTISIFNHIIQNQKTIDNLICDTLSNYKFNRINIAELSILRLGFFRLIDLSARPQSKMFTIKECSRLANKFCSIHSKPFIYAVLNTYTDSLISQPI